MIVTMFIFAVQDGISSHLAERYNTITVVMIRPPVFLPSIMCSPDWPPDPMHPKPASFGQGSREPFPSAASARFSGIRW